MYITLESDYAVRIVYCLTRENRRMDAKTIAENTGVTLRFSLKILRKMVASGIARSFKGISGGYELAKAPSEISLKDVIEATEGPFVYSRCLKEDDDYVCSNSQSSVCKFQPVFDHISCVVKKELEKYTYDQFID